MTLFVFLFGLLFGSFANVILLRLNTGESIVFSGSRCFSCAQKLSWLDLIPLFSFFLLRGRCRSCKSKISIQYPLVEFGTGILFVLIFWKLSAGGGSVFGGEIENLLEIGNWLQPGGLAHIGKLGIAGLLILLSWFFLWVASLYDIRHMILPDKILFTAFVFGIAGFVSDCFLLHAACNAHGALLQFGVGMLLFLFFFLLWFFSHGNWMGLGDGKLIIALTPLLGASLLFLGVVLSFFIGSVAGIFLFLFRGAGLKTKIPFGPFLLLGAFISFLVGERIISWYMGLFL